MNTEERLAQINEVSQRILNMPEAERQAYIEQYWDAINEMLNEYQELRRPRQSMAKDPITERTPEQQAALSWDQPTQEAPRQRRRKQDRRQDIPDVEETPTKENEWPVIVKTNSDWTVSDANGNNYNVDKDWNIVSSAAGTWSQSDVVGTWSNPITPKGSSNNSWADGSMWPLYWLWGLAALWAYWAMRWINAKNKPKIIPPGADIPALWEVREWKLVSEWLLSDGKVIQQWPKWHLPNNSEAIKTDIKKFMSTPEWKSLVNNSKVTTPDLIKQRMSNPMMSNPLEWYHTPVAKNTAENVAENVTKTASKKAWKNVSKDLMQKALKLVF